jgi:threonine aldolase
MRRQFGSDNYSGICPEAWEALEEANRGHALPYGDDEWTRAACDAVREALETDYDVYFVFNGTAANSLALAAMCQSYHSVIMHEMAHVETDECGAPEFFSNGTKLLPVGGAHAKLDLALVEHAVLRRTDIHYPKPRVLSVTQATECGTVYSVDEVRAAGELARRLGLKLHMDGARLGNAVAHLGAAPADITWRAGADVLCWGMTKCGIAAGEAVVFFNRQLAAEFDYRCKQAGQLVSKMRYLAAPWAAMLRDGAWLRHAAHANACAERLERGLRALPGARVLFPREANSVFVEVPEAAAEALHAIGWHFYNFIGSGGQRFMCSWDTTEEDVDALLRDLGEAMRTAR